MKTKKNDAALHERQQTEKTGLPPVFSSDFFDFRENGGKRDERLSLTLYRKDDPVPLARDVCRFSDTVRFFVTVPRCLAAENGKLRIFRDDDGAVLWRSLKRYEPGEKKTDAPSCKDISPACECFCVSVPAGVFCAAQETDGLAYYRFEFDTSLGHCYFSKAPAGLFPILRFRDEEIAAFQMTVTGDAFDAPAWLRGGILYHIFVDRFCRGEETMRKYGVSIPRRENAEYNPDWYGGIPQHAKIPGGFVKNNEFFGGNLWGVAEKLPYLSSLGVTAIYLSPIFSAYSNHKYDTGDYETVDAGFGGDEAFSYLIEEAKKYGIRILCDGVFNHTGDDSRYFNRAGNYPDVGAYQSKDSPYYPWFRFREYPDDYECWWNVKTLPAVHSESPAVREYFCGEGGILQKWMKRGVWGWRLDVADELSDAFLCDVRTRIKTENPDAMLYGEVWEDASHKIAYGRRRKYFRGKQLDSVMNYPFREGILSYLKTGDAAMLAETAEEIVRHYPEGCVHTLMNLLGTHDTERVLTALAAPPAGERDNDALASAFMTKEERADGILLLRIAALLQYTLPGVPCVYYGDEAGMEGYRDPFNRRPYPWGREEKTLLAWYRTLGELRHEHPVFADGDFTILCAENGVFCFSRSDERETLIIAVNLGDAPYYLPFPCSDLSDGAVPDLISGEEGTIPPMYGSVFRKESKDIPDFSV